MDSVGVAKIRYNQLDTLSSEQIIELFYDRQKLKTIVQRYNINIENIDSTRFIIEAQEIDSALILLPYYRDKLKYIPEKNAWQIIVVN